MAETSYIPIRFSGDARDAVTAAQQMRTALRSVATEASDASIQVERAASRQVLEQAKQVQGSRQLLEQYRLQGATAERGSAQQVAAMRLAEREARKLGDTTHTSTLQARRGFDDSERSLSRLVRGGIVGTGVFRGLGRQMAFASSAFLGGAGAVAVLRSSVSAASNLHEQIQKVGVVFAGSSKDVVRWSGTLARSFGIARNDALSMAGVFGNMLVPMGFARDKAAVMSKSLVQLGADMASFNNASMADTLAAIQSGLAGQVRPLRQYGVFLDQARIKQEALNLGLWNGKGNLNAAAKAAASYAIILKDTKDAQGDFARTSHGLANQQRILHAEIKNLQEDLGKALMPAVLAVTRSLVDWLSQTKNQQTVQKDFKATIHAVAEAVKILVEAFRLVKGPAQAATDAVGGLKNALKLLAVVAIANKLSGIASGITGIGTAAAGSGTAGGMGEFPTGGAAGKVGRLRLALRNLATLGTVTVLIEVLMNKKSIDKVGSQIDGILNDAFGHIPGFNQSWAHGKLTKDGVFGNKGVGAKVVGTGAGSTYTAGQYGASGTAQQRAVVATAKTQLGIPYQYGGAAKLGGHTDCSGFVQAVLAKNGIHVPRTSQAQFAGGKSIGKGDLQPGDLVFFEDAPDGPHHVGLYIGNDQFIEDPHTGASVRTSTFSSRGGYVGARRYGVKSSSGRAGTTAPTGTTGKPKPPTLQETLAYNLSAAKLTPGTADDLKALHAIDANLSKRIAAEKNIVKKTALIDEQVSVRSEIASVKASKAGGGTIDRKLGKPAGAPMFGQQLVNYIATRSSALGLDPEAVLAVASVEGGFNGSVGDNGSSFGPFQLHAGGALPESVWAHGPLYARAWANTPAGVDYALNQIAKVAGGAKGASAVSLIVRKFEHPAAPGAEVGKATGRLGSTRYAIDPRGAQGSRALTAAKAGVPAPTRQALLADLLALTVSVDKLPDALQASIIPKVKAIGATLAGMVTPDVRRKLLGQIKALRTEATREIQKFADDAFGRVRDAILNAYDQKVTGRVAGNRAFAQTQLGTAQTQKKADRARGQISSAESGGLSPAMQTIKEKGEAVLSAWELVFAATAGTVKDTSGLERAVGQLAEAQNQFESIGGELTDVEQAYLTAYQTLIDAKASLGEGVLDKYQTQTENKGKLGRLAVEKNLNKIYGQLRQGKISLDQARQQITDVLAPFGLSLADLGNTLDNSELTGALNDLTAAILNLHGSLTGGGKGGGVTVMPAGAIPVEGRPGGAQLPDTTPIVVTVNVNSTATLDGEQVAQSVANTVTRTVRRGGFFINDL